MRKALKITVHLAVFISWITLISLLLFKTYYETSLEKSSVLRESFVKRTYWYDIYRENKKIGFARTIFKKAGDEILIEHKREIKFKTNEDEKPLLETLKVLCDQDYSIKFFEHTSNFKGEKGHKVRGEADENEIVFFLESPEKNKTYNIPVSSRDFYLPITVIPAIHNTLKMPAPDTPFSIPMLDSINLAIDNVKSVLEEIRPVKIGINIESLYKFRIGDSVIWSNEKGIVIKEDLPSGITLYSQHENIAMDSGDRIIFDFTSLPFFKANRSIPDTETLTLLKVRLKGFEINPLLYKDSPVTLEDNIITIAKQDIKQLKEKTYTLPYKQKDEVSGYISPDEWILSDYKPLKDTGIVYARARDNDAFIFAQYLSGYVYNIVKTAPAFFLSNSRDIHKSLSGDYLEKTILFATYARAGGLPVRPVGGLVYVNGYFYFHIWPEVWFGKWVPADPAFAQFPADVTHIPLITGTVQDIISIINDLEDVKIEILEAS